MGNNQETAAIEEVKNDFMNGRISHGLPLPPDDYTYDIMWSRLNRSYFVYNSCRIPYKNIKGIYMKYPYTGKITLDIGGTTISEVYNNDGIDKNMLEILDYKLPLHLLKYHETVLRTDNSLLLPSDIRIEYSDEAFPEEYTQEYTDANGIKSRLFYRHGMLGKSEAVAES